MLEDVVLDVERRLVVRGFYFINRESLLTISQAWDVALAPGMHYIEDNIRSQRLLLETLFNSGAWCFFTAHLMYACAVLGVTYVSPLDFVWISPRSLLLQAPELGCSEMPLVHRPLCVRPAPYDH
jgi:hypothetical protein